MGTYPAVAALSMAKYKEYKKLPIRFMFTLGNVIGLLPMPPMYYRLLFVTNKKGIITLSQW